MLKKKFCGIFHGYLVVDRQRERERERERERDTQRERERKREEESTLLWLSSLARVRLHLRCFGFFFLSFQGGGQFWGFSLANLEVRLPKVKFS